MSLSTQADPIHLQLISTDNGKVVFTYRDRANNNELKNMTVTAEEFIRRTDANNVPDDWSGVWTMTTK